MTAVQTPCAACGVPLDLLLDDPCCPCGGAPRIPPLASPGSPGEWGAGPQTGWRYRAAFPFADGAAPVSLGEGFVAVEPLALPGLESGVLALRDDLQPTGSWKDRGSTLLVTMLSAAARKDLFEDSSGNAALSLARYARAAGMRLTAFVPQSATAEKKELVRAAGAELVEVAGPRDRATAAARKAAREGGTYAGHAYQPLHAAGAATAAFNIVECLQRVPRTIVGAAGQGGYLAGVHAGFVALAASGLGPPPRIVAVQPSACAPIAAAFARGAASAAPWPALRPSLAEGASISSPARARELLEAVRATSGTVASVDEFAIDRALRLLWMEGLRVEPTAALPVAWLLQRQAAREPEPLGETVVLLSGHGVRDGLPLFPGLSTPP